MTKQEQITEAKQVEAPQEAILRTLFGCVENRSGTDDDLKRATDYVCDGVVVAARYRSFDHWRRYWIGDGQATIRKTQASGRMTEYQKVVTMGYGRYMLYCGLADDGKQIMGWIVIDLDRLRALIRQGEAGELPLTWPVPQAAVDDRGVNWFQPIPIREWLVYDPTLIAASSDAGGWIDHGAGWDAVSDEPVTSEQKRALCAYFSPKRPKSEGVISGENFIRSLMTDEADDILRACARAAKRCERAHNKAESFRIAGCQ